MARGEKKPVVMTGDIGKTVPPKLHAGQHAAGAEDPITLRMIGASGQRGLLHNWYFANSVNQRGQAEYTADASGWVQTVDGWKILNATLTRGDGCWNFVAPEDTNYNFLVQQTEHTLKSGETYTLSILAKINEIGTAATLRPRTSEGSPITTPTGSTGKSITAATVQPELFTYTFTPTDDVVNVGVELLVSNQSGYYLNADIYAVKLEKGSVQTLAYQNSSGNWVLNELPDYGEELRKCQRYQVVYMAVQYGQYWLATATTATNAKVCIQTPEVLRVNPSIIFDTSCLVLYDGSTEYPVSDVSLFTKSSNLATLSLTTSGLTTGKTYMVRATEATKVILDANL